MFDTGKGIVFAGVETKAEAIRIIGRVGFSGHRHLEHFKFLKAHCKFMPKMTIPAPSTMHFRQGRQNISKQAYPDMDAFFDESPRPTRRRSARSMTPVAATCRWTTPPGR